MTSLRHLVMPTRVLPHHSIGGMQTVAWELAIAFVKRGIQVTILTAEIPGRPKVFEDSGVRVLALPGTSWRRYGRLWWSATRVAFEQELLGRCDLVLSVSAAGYGLLPLRHRAPKMPFVLQSHGTAVGEVISKWRSGSVKAAASSVRNVAWIIKDLAAYRHFDAIVPVGERVATDLASWLISHIVDQKRVKLIRNGIDTVVFRPDNQVRKRLRSEMGWNEDTKVIVSVSRLHRQKGLNLALDAFAVLTKRQPTVRYLIVGEGPELEALKAQATTLGVRASVHFAGGVGRECIPAYLNATDVMLFTTTHVEVGESLNVLEAQAVGLPVVASRHLYPDGAPNGQVLLADQNSPETVVTALQCAFQIKPCRTSTLPPRLSMTESVDAYLNLFDELIARRQ